MTKLDRRLDMAARDAAADAAAVTAAGVTNAPMIGVLIDADN